MFDSSAILHSWCVSHLRSAAQQYRGIIEIRDADISMIMDEGDGMDHGSIDHVCQSYCAYPQSMIVVSGVGVRESGSVIRLSVEIDADDFSFAQFLDEIQEIADVESD